MTTERVLAAIALAVCVVLFVRLLIGARRRDRLDAALRRATRAVRGMAMSVRHRREAARVADAAIKRPRHTMKITNARVIVCCPGRNFVTLKIETDEGLTGIGDATLNGRELAVAAYLDRACHSVPDRPRRAPDRGHLAVPLSRRVLAAAGR